MRTFAICLRIDSDFFSTGTLKTKWREKSNQTQSTLFKCNFLKNGVAVCISFKSPSFLIDPFAIGSLNRLKMRNQLKYGIAQTEPKTMNQLKIDGFLK